jgi:hypothetical protein
MLPVVTSIHDPAALAATCKRLGLPPPERGSGRLGDREVSGWVVHLFGLRPVVCDTLSGLILYHPLDNAHGRYARLMHFVQSYYSVRARLRKSAPARSFGRRRRLQAGEVA